MKRLRQMLIRINDRERLAELRAYFGARRDVVVEQVGEVELEVSLLGSYDAAEHRCELERLLAAAPPGRHERRPVDEGLLVEDLRERRSRPSLRVVERLDEDEVARASDKGALLGSDEREEMVEKSLAELDNRQLLAQLEAQLLELRRRLESAVEVAGDDIVAADQWFLVAGHVGPILREFAAFADEVRGRLLALVGSANPE